MNPRSLRIEQTPLQRIHFREITSLTHAALIMWTGGNCNDNSLQKATVYWSKEFDQRLLDEEYK